MRRVVPSLTMCLLLVAIAFSSAEAEQGVKADLTLNPILPVFVGPVPISPPAVRFDEHATVHLAWLEKTGPVGAVKSVRIGQESKAVAIPVQVNPEALPPDAFHQAPGLATGKNDHVFVSWSTTNRSPGSLFASDLRVARSQDGGQTFHPPVQVNDDGLPISHTFEDMVAGNGSDLYVAWLDGRGKDQSGAAVLFGCSNNQGQTMGKNLTVDGMACPCCRPMVAVAPNGHLWVAWRKTFAGNVRDIVLAKSEDRGQTFSSPLLVHKDNWVFSACPHRGPSIGFDRFGRIYVGWYTEGTDEQPRLLVATSDDQGRTFSSPLSLHTSTTSLPDQMRMAVHPDGAVVAVWEEITGVRKRAVMRVSMDRGQHFGPLQVLSTGAKAEYPTVAIHDNGAVALSWTEHAFPMNRILLQRGMLTLTALTGQP
ncbi:MAG: sialidase family protein [Nitrospirota bacterium]